MTNDSKIAFNITISKIAALAIIAMSPIFLDGYLMIQGWGIASLLLGGKQAFDAYKHGKTTSND